MIIALLTALALAGTASAPTPASTAAAAAAATPLREVVYKVSFTRPEFTWRDRTKQIPTPPRSCLI
jgi:hypothetical protein